MADLERVQGRLENIRTVEPILGALRTISLGSWQAALKQREGLHRYGERLQGILSLLATHLQTRRQRPVPASQRVAALAVGSERGLCGRFNETVADLTEQYLARQANAGVTVELLVLGGRLQRILERRRVPLAWAGPLPTTALPSFAQAFDFTRRWLARYEAGELDAVDLLYNAYRGMGQYEPLVARLIPPEAPPVGSAAADVSWRPTILETEPWTLYARVVEQWAALSFYALLLDSAAAEHVTRYQLMEAAAQNADRLSEELLLELQSIRRHAVTSEMQELAVGAGLVGGG